MTAITATDAANDAATAAPGTRLGIRALRPPIYPAVFPVAFLLNFWAGTNADPHDIVRSILVALAVSLVVSCVATVVAGRTRGGLAASAVLAGLMAPPDSPGGPFLIGVGIIVLVEGAIHRARPLRQGPLIDRVMAALASIILVAVGIKILTGGALARGVADWQLDGEPRAPSAAAAEAARGDAPDIVMIMLDGYPGDAAARLAAKAGSPYDPDLFPDALGRLGFHVQRNSHSNYLLTPMTLASVLDMRHLIEVPDLMAAGGDAAGGRGFRRVADDGRAFDILHDLGYELIWVDGGFSHIEIRRVDRWIDHGMPSEMEIRVLSDTLAGHAINAAAPDLLSSLHRNRITTTIADASRLLDEPHDQPRFVFVHVPSPHAPWIFGPNGEPRSEGLESFFMDPAGVRDIDRDEAMRRVFGQATYIANQTLDVLDDLTERDNPPVVVLFSDHGPGTEIDFNEPAKTDLVERSSNFFATFAPRQPKLFDTFTTPVNIFPTLFDGYFGMDVPRSPDTIYAWSGPEINLFPVDVAGTNSR
jgi:hypothetical protein